MLRDQPPRPANMKNIVAINQGKRPYTAGRPEIRIVAPEEAARMVESGHAAIDVRSPRAYEAGHVPGAYNVHLASAAFEQNVGWIRAGENPFVLIADSPGQAPVAAEKLAFVGLDGAAEGFVVFEDWVKQGLPVTGLACIEIDELASELRAGRIRVLDVRERSEWDSGHIEEAIHASFKDLAQSGGRLPLAAGAPVAVICAGGTRSTIACGMLRANGYRQVLNVQGGMDAWRAAGLPVVRP